jgi:uncharacterized protein (TIGR02145 family)
VVINGIKWATCNVGAKRTFASAPEQPGEYYDWEDAQAACPEGWRLPTKTEMEKLLSASKEWTTQNGVQGWLIGNKPNTIFLPAAGILKYGKVDGFGSHGFYWSGTKSENSEYLLRFWEGTTEAIQSKRYILDWIPRLRSE